MDGNDCAKLVMSSWGEEDGDEEGDGGPKLEGETRVCGDGETDGGAGDTMEALPFTERDGDMGGVGRFG